MKMNNILCLLIILAFCMPSLAADAQENDVDSLWILNAGFLVFFMQTGFAALEVGSVKSIGAINVLLKNMVDNCVGSLIWWLVGYMVAFGPDLFDKGFIGGKSGKFFGGIDMEDTPNGYRDCFFQLAFATTSATIVSGGIAGRTRFWTYVGFSALMTSIIYPVVVHWTWGSGWLFDNDYYDFAGSGIVHMVGGLSALMGAIAAGPRKDRFTPGHEAQFKAHNTPLVVLGTLILWFGWFGFNAGSTLSMHGADVQNAARVAVNTMVAAASGGIFTFTIRSTYGQNAQYSIGAMCNGVLAGLVAVTAPCGNIYPWEAVIIGIIGGGFYTAFSKLVLMLKIDDPLDAFSVHYGAGICGVWVVGFFDKDKGLFFGGGAKQLWVQFYASVAITLWVAFWSGLFFQGMKKMGKLRITVEHEKAGLDKAECGGQAYYFDAVPVKDAKGQQPEQGIPDDPKPQKVNKEEIQQQV